MFIIVAETLNARVKNAMRIGLINGRALPQCNSQQSISQYVDNPYFSVRAEEASVDNLVANFQGFGPPSGLHINWHKKRVYWCG